MFRAIPISNKICFDKDIKRSWKIHQAKLKKLTSSVSKDRPKEYTFLDQKAKKFALQEIRNIEVDRQNKILLQKITDISSKGTKTSYAKINTDVSIIKKRTLNQPYRKKQLVKIVEQNQQILKRLSEKKSLYNMKKMGVQRRQVQNNINLISQYPYKGYPVKRTPVNLWVTSEGFYRKNIDESQGNILNFTYSGTQKINDNYYVINSYLVKGFFHVEIENLEDSVEKYRIQLTEIQAKNLLQLSFDNSIEKLANSLEINKEQQSCYLKYEIKPVKN